MIIPDHFSQSYTGYITKLAMESINEKIREQVSEIAAEIASDIVSKIDIKKIIIEAIPSDGGDNFVMTISVSKPKDVESKPHLPIQETTIPRLIRNVLLRHGIISWEMLQAEVEKNGFTYISQFKRIGPRAVGILSRMIQKNDPHYSW